MYHCLCLNPKLSDSKTSVRATVLFPTFESDVEILASSLADRPEQGRPDGGPILVGVSQLLEPVHIVHGKRGVDLGKQLQQKQVTVGRGV